MARQGNLLGYGYVPGLGAVRVYDNVEGKDTFFVAHTKTDRTRFVHRSKIQWRKKPGTKEEQHD